MRVAYIRGARRLSLRTCGKTAILRLVIGLQSNLDHNAVWKRLTPVDRFVPCRVRYLVSAGQ
jgi:hypothetical protein